VGKCLHYSYKILEIISLPISGCGFQLIIAKCIADTSSSGMPYAYLFISIIFIQDYNPVKNKLLSCWSCQKKIYKY